MSPDAEDSRLIAGNLAQCFLSTRVENFDHS